jgi:uncharacterized protein (DUF58 family)
MGCAWLVLLEAGLLLACAAGGLAGALGVVAVFGVLLSGTLLSASAALMAAATVPATPASTDMSEDVSVQVEHNLESIKQSNTFLPVQES